MNHRTLANICRPTPAKEMEPFSVEEPEWTKLREITFDDQNVGTQLMKSYQEPEIL